MSSVNKQLWPAAVSKPRRVIQLPVWLIPDLSSGVSALGGMLAVSPGKARALHLDQWEKPPLRIVD